MTCSASCGTLNSRNHKQKIRGIQALLGGIVMLIYQKKRLEYKAQFCLKNGQPCLVMRGAFCIQSFKPCHSCLRPKKMNIQNLSLSPVNLVIFNAWKLFKNLLVTHYSHLKEQSLFASLSHFDTFHVHQLQSILVKSVINTKTLFLAFITIKTYSIKNVIC